MVGRKGRREVRVRERVGVEILSIKWLINLEWAKVHDEVYLYKG